MTAINTALYLLISIAFNIYIYILILRLFMQKFNANWFNPFTQLVVKLTDPLVKPLRRVIPGFKGFDIAIIGLCLLLQLIMLWLLIWLQIGVFFNVIATLVVAIAQLGMKVVNLFFYLTILAVVISWIPSLQQNPISEIIILLTEPLLRLVRRVLPTIAGFDFSPVVIIIGCLLINILIFGPLGQLGLSLAA